MRKSGLVPFEKFFKNFSRPSDLLAFRKHNTFLAFEKDSARVETSGH